MSSTKSDWPPDIPDIDKLSEAKQKILKLLWSMEWVEGRVILQEIDQSYYDRRIRELRDDCGWNIVTEGTGRQTKYRLTSREKSPGNKRTYPSSKQKKTVLERDKGLCQICGVADETMQYDHKIPLNRQGKTIVGNLQLLCRACNVKKRGVCKKCTLPTCENCPYAYPELFGTRITLFLDSEIKGMLESESKKQGAPEWIILKEIITSYFEDKNPDVH